MLTRNDRQYELVSYTSWVVIPYNRFSWNCEETMCSCYHSSPQEFKHATFQTHACLSCNSRKFPEGGSVIKLKQPALQCTLVTARPSGTFANLLRKLVSKLKRQTKIYQTRERKWTLGCWIDRYRHREEREAVRDKSRLSAGSSRFLFRPSQHTCLKKRGRRRRKRINHH